ncbi:unnamed protein product [Blepharisma stoltei]|uniref:Uncharacterized protein n=1 Tax=Blepharisma stoltei TaxID=1481888 RepID=A0AAU9J2W6_9CILI|nr:unnamed protein product [Blepharisma stoltei]
MKAENEKSRYILVLESFTDSLSLSSSKVTFNNFTEVIEYTNNKKDNPNTNKDIRANNALQELASIAQEFQDLRIDGQLKPTSNNYIARIDINGNITDLKTGEELATRLPPEAIAKKTKICISHHDNKSMTIGAEPTKTSMKKAKTISPAQKSTVSPRVNFLNTCRERSITTLKKVGTNRKHLGSINQEKQQVAEINMFDPDSPIQTRSRSKTETSQPDNIQQTRNRSSTEIPANSVGTARIRSRINVEVPAAEKQPRTRSHTPVACKTRMEFDIIKPKHILNKLKLPDPHDHNAVLRSTSTSGGNKPRNYAHFPLPPKGPNDSPKALRIQRRIKL